MKWVLIIYFIGSHHWMPDQVLHYESKQDCMEALDNLYEHSMPIRLTPKEARD